MLGSGSRGAEGLGGKAAAGDHGCSRYWSPAHGTHGAEDLGRGRRGTAEGGLERFRGAARSRALASPRQAGPATPMERSYAEFLSRLGALDIRPESCSETELATLWDGYLEDQVQHFHHNSNATVQPGSLLYCVLEYSKLCTVHYECSLYALLYSKAARQSKCVGVL